MRLNHELLNKFVNLPEQSPEKLRFLLDELGLEVDGIEKNNGVAVYSIETLANRGDHLSALGVAREFSARYQKSLCVPEPKVKFPSAKLAVKIKLNTDKCLVYHCLEARIKSGIQTNSEIKKYLEDTDLELHPVVQISNYILKELGEPTHAFDADKVEGDIRIELSTEAEEVIALDSKTYTIPAGAVLIRDAKKTIAVAGVIGLANTMVTETTTRVYLESACFDPVAIRKTARAMSLSTDASYLFERGADPEMPPVALARYAELLGESAEVIGCDTAGVLPQPRIINLNLVRIAAHSNIKNLNFEEVQNRLAPLGYKVSKPSTTGDFTATVPSWRMWSVATEAAIIEDFCRAYGYNNLELVLPPLSSKVRPKNQIEQILEAVEPVLTANGFNEVVTRSYYSNEDVKLLGELNPESQAEHVKVLNSMEGAYSNMRTTNILHAARLVEKNLRAGLETVKVYELSRIFSVKGFSGSPYQYETDVLSLAAAGRFNLNRWKKPEAAAELLNRVSGVIQDMLSALKIKFTLKASNISYLHPGQQAAIISGGKVIGHLGLMHPLIKDRLKVSKDMIYAEVRLLDLAGCEKRGSIPKIIDYPQIRRDINLKVPLRIYAGEIIEKLQTLKPLNIAAIDIVDSFQKAEEDFSRVTYRLTFQNPERTLESQEVDDEMKRLLLGLEKEFSIRMVV